jgi:hypothetical protein
LSVVFTLSGGAIESNPVRELPEALTNKLTTAIPSRSFKEFCQMLKFLDDAKIIKPYRKNKNKKFTQSSPKTLARCKKGQNCNKFPAKHQDFFRQKGIYFREISICKISFHCHITC